MTYSTPTKQAAMNEIFLSSTAVYLHLQCEVLPMGEAESHIYSFIFLKPSTFQTSWSQDSHLKSLKLYMSSLKISVMTEWLVWTGLMSFKWKSQCGKVSPQLLHSQFLLHLFIYSTGSKYRSPHSQMHQLGWPPSTQSTQLDSFSKQGRVTSDTSAIPIHHLHT